MTTIPSLNIVVQQGDLVRETQNIRNQALDSSQLAAIERLEEEDKKRSSVPRTEATEDVQFNKDTLDDKKKKHEQSRSRQRKTGDKKTDGKKSSTGRLLDTIV